ncbi:MAG: HRDC domain-containing protein [Caldilineaceae bacterium]|nr:HRDC domain-containing protein [Caldilineaceae bacterium]
MTRQRRTKRRPQAIASPKLVQTTAEFGQFLGHVSGQPWLALDTESDSLFRYAPRVCLIQITAPEVPAGAQSLPDPANVVDFLIDPLRLKNLSGLGDILADGITEVILHAAENDILTLQRDFDFRLQKIYDTQLAARILGRQGIGLAKVLDEEFGVVSDKKMQRTNWGQRPLTQQQLTYAQIDTHYLPALRARQIKSLEEAGRWEEAKAAFRMLESIRFSPPEPRAFWQMKQIRSVEERDLGVLQAVWEWRESFAHEVDRPPFKVLGENALVHLSQKRPRTLSSLKAVPGLSERQVRWFGRKLLAAVREGEQRPAPQRPTSNRKTDPALTAAGKKRYEALRQWRTETAAARGVDPDIVFSNETLQQISTSRPATLAELEKIPSVGKWKAQAYGAKLFRLLRNGLES